MESKKYFKKFGKMWLFLGIILTLLLFVIQWIEFSTNRYVIENAAKFGQSITEFMVSYWLPSIIWTSLLFGFVPFLTGFLGLIRLFWLLVVLEVIYFIIALLEQGSPNNWAIFFIGLPLLFLAVLVGVIWEVIHYYRFKKSVS